MANVVKLIQIASRQANVAGRYAASSQLARSITTSEQRKNPPVLVSNLESTSHPYLSNYPLLSYVDVAHQTSKTRSFSTTEQKNSPPVIISLEPTLEQPLPASNPYLSNYPLLSYVDVTQKAEQDNDSYSEALDEASD
jgi:hypothetical protein